MYEIDCDQALADLEAYMDGELPDDARLRMEEHLGGCSPCFARSEFRLRVREIVRRKCGASVEMPARVAGRIRAVIASTDRSNLNRSGPP